ncbi:molybdenum ABC transporter ATP-binding protein [Flexibacterium corallicola]|uniref:molybdenum ABC transporter ATP-binding protein n=1 Tax=Flexibacterium corallicola TaxID=3037259 RepID=UPI00286F1DBA|nr:molybdenum ABC transporter ATP-binding protein [Pseudovibrio sp. M1P-2-3]
MIEVSIGGQLGTFSISAHFESEGGVSAVFGASGSGKSSLMRMISGLEKPRTGYVRLNGRTVFDAQKRVNVPIQRRRLGIVFQEARLFPHFSVAANLRFGRWGKRSATKQEFTQVVDLLGIGHLLGRSPHHLSGGEQQRVAIGRALLSRPEILIMDEPMSSLDERRRGELLPFLGRLKRELKLPMLYVSHSLPEIEQLADSILLMDEGKTVAFGPFEEILSTHDLGPVLKGADKGSLLVGKVGETDQTWALTTILLKGAQIQLPKLDVAQGTSVRLHVNARDVILSHRLVEGTSLRNTMAVQVASIKGVDDAHMEVLCKLEQQSLRARVTRQSANELGLREGQKIYAMIKSAALSQNLAV